MSNNKHKAGFVSIIGRPNVGKSTLINSLMKEKLSIITSKAQTTRHRIRGIINEDDYQIVLSDTPGILNPSYKLQEAMMKFIKETLIDSDFLVIVEEVGNKESFDRPLIQKLNSFKIPIILLIIGSVIFVWASIQLSEQVIFYIGGLGLVINLPRLITELLPDNIWPPLILFLVGGVLVAVGLYLNSIRENLKN